MKYSDEQRIKRIYENAVKLHEYIVTHNINKEDLLVDIPLQWLVTTPLYNIGERVYNLSDQYKKMHGERDKYYEKIGFKPLIHWTFWEKKLIKEI